MKNYILLLFIGITFLNCSNDDDTGTSANLVGTWDWERSSGGITGETTTPESTGSTMTLEITNSIIRRYLNDDLLSERSYSIEVRESMSGEFREMLILESGSRQIINIEGNTLTLIGDCNDCFISEYSRTN